MLIVIVTFTTTAPDAALSLLRADASRTRALPGNIAFDVLQNAQTPAQITLLQRWRDLASLEAHKQAEGMKTLGAKLMPLMDGAPVTSVFEATPVSP